MLDYSPHEHLTALVNAIIQPAHHNTPKVRPAHMPRIIRTSAEGIAHRLAVLMTQPEKEVLSELGLPETIPNLILVQQLQIHLRQELKTLQKGK